jgi:putative membrane protein
MSKKLLSSFTIAAAIAVGFALPSYATDPSLDVLTDLHHANQMEIQMGKLAQKQGHSDAVKKFGDTLVKDHSDADKKVVDLAKSQNVKLPDDDMAKMPMGDDEKKTVASLKQKHGPAFDRAFAQAMVDDHKKDIGKLEAAQPKVAGTPTGDLVATLLPVIKNHEQIAESLLNK